MRGKEGFARGGEGGGKQAWEVSMRETGTGCERGSGGREVEGARERERGCALACIGGKGLVLLVSLVTYCYVSLLIVAEGWRRRQVPGQRCRARYSSALGRGVS